MKRKHRFQILHSCVLGVSCLLAALYILSADASAQNGVQIDLNRAKAVPKIPLKKDAVKFAPDCPNPAAYALAIENIRRRSAGSDIIDFDVGAVVRNTGRQRWASAAGQQSAVLSLSGAGPRRTLAKGDFPSLAASQQVALRARLSVTTGEEFPPDINLSLVYGPDIFADGNTQNDDCNRNDNKRTIKGPELMRRIRDALR